MLSNTVESLTMSMHVKRGNWSLNLNVWRYMDILVNVLFAQFINHWWRLKNLEDDGWTSLITSTYIPFTFSLQNTLSTFKPKGWPMLVWNGCGRGGEVGKLFGKYLGCTVRFWSCINCIKNVAIKLPKMNLMVLDIFKVTTMTQFHLKIFQYILFTNWEPLFCKATCHQIVAFWYLWALLKFQETRKHSRRMRTDRCSSRH